MKKWILIPFKIYYLIYICCFSQTIIFPSSSKSAEQDVLQREQEIRRQLLQHNYPPFYHHTFLRILQGYDSFLLSNKIPNYHTLDAHTKKLLQLNLFKTHMLDKYVRMPIQPRIPELD